MKKISIITTLLLISGLMSFAQDQHFTTSGTIEFDKTSNQHAMFERQINKDNEAYMKPAYEQFKKTQPQFKTYKNILTFGDNKSLYTAAPTDATPNINFQTVMADQNNTVYTDLNTNISTVQKKVFEETFLVKDTVRKINWKITDETREIAGYTCRRANAIMMDSIYVVAFYTDKIMVTGGPECFTGLPGMILEVALPHENIIWRATKVTDVAVPQTTIAAPKKGKAVDLKGFKAALDGGIKAWGTYAHMYYKAFLM